MCHLGEMIFYLLVFSLQGLHVAIAQDDEQLFVVPGSCSTRCQTVLVPEISQLNVSLVNLPRFNCSCSPSCSIYGDCCYDSEFQTQANHAAKSSSLICLTLTNRGRFRVVANCPRDWFESSDYCTESIGHLPPVTSKKTGTTYGNMYCAICNGDGSEVKTWNVELRCCEEHEHLQDRRFIYRRGHLWSSVRSTNSGPTKCLCKYHADSSQYSFFDTLELRTCDFKTEISKCSQSWSNYTVQELCSSYVDPVYSTSKVYRNLHCAQCNYESVPELKCKPAIVEQMESKGKSPVEILEACYQRNLTSCVQFIRNDSKGKPYALSDLLNINEKTCVPDPGKRCCSGQRYDFRSKRCRNVS